MRRLSSKENASQMGSLIDFKPGRHPAREASPVNVCIGVLCLLQGVSCSSTQLSLVEAILWAWCLKAAHLANPL